MIDSAILLGELKAVVTKLETDILNRCRENDAVDAPLRLEFEAAKQNNRTAVAYEVWRGEFITQAAVAWVLATVFVRFIEDNGLLDGRDEKRAWISGAKEEGEGRNHRLQIAQDTHLQYFRANPSHTDREYLQWVFRTVCNPTGDRPIRALEGLFDERHNPLWRVGISGDGAATLLNFWQKVNPETGQVVHDFTDPQLDTRFLGDLYQDLSEAARKKYALLQTPIFVEEFILDRTLTPAIAEFGLDEVRLIDPTCGSGHFLLGAFERLFKRHQKEKPAVEPRKLAQTALEQVYGVDLNPFATAIARFRLLIAALKASEIKRLQDAPDFRFNLATGDSLLHGKRFDGKFRGTQIDLYDDKLQHHYETEDIEELKRILGQQYSAVVGNPPYIIVRDSALNQAYRDRFDSCHGKYSLGIPFTERFFDLTLKEQKNQNGDGQTKYSAAGFTGMITTNSFMKREFGKKLIEEFIPLWDLTHMIDTSGAFIPGHGTPTVILFGRNRKPTSDTIRAVLGIKGEPSTPLVPSNGKVWQSIVTQVDVSDSQNEFVSVVDMLRENFHRHPWNIGGGGASQVKDFLEQQSHKELINIVETIGVSVVTLEDDAFTAPKEVFIRSKVADNFLAAFVEGVYARDWVLNTDVKAIFPYDWSSLEVQQSASIDKYLWKYRTNLKNRLWFRQTQEQRNLRWFEYGTISKEKFLSPLSILFPFVASHNHFILDRGGKIFNRSVPVIKLSTDSIEDEHLTLIGLLNSSSVCFWMKQVSQQKQMTGGDGIRIESRSKVPYEFAGTQLERLPIPKKFFVGILREKLLGISKVIDSCANRINKLSPENAIEKSITTETPISEVWQEYVSEKERLRAQLIFLQEEIDFTVYCMFGLADESLLSDFTEPLSANLEAGERPFCIIAGKNEDDFPVPEEVPEEWDEKLKDLWQKRIDAIKNSPELTLIEDAHYKRRWIGRQGLFNHSRNTEDDELKDACRNWMLNRLESEKYWKTGELLSAARLADKVRTDTEFMQVAEVYRDRPDFDFTKLIGELVKPEAVPLLPVLRYKDSGMIKRSVWERTWEAQRREDAIEKRVRDEYQKRVAASDGDSKIEFFEKYIREEIEREVGEIEVPPKYTNKDFRDANFWRLRGKLDVPKERFVSFPYAERDADQSLVIGWAGWNHLELAQAIAGYYTNARQKEGWSNERLVPLLGAVIELIPWIRQWHDEYNLEYGGKPVEFFESFVEEEARSLGLSLNRIREWNPFL